MPNNHVKVALVVPRALVKKVKTALEEQNLLSKSRKITPFQDPNGDEQRPRMVIPTTTPLQGNDQDQELLPREIVEKNTLSRLLHQCDLQDFTDGIETLSYDAGLDESDPLDDHPIRRVLKVALAALPPDLLSSLQLSLDDLLNPFPSTYVVYPPMLLLYNWANTSPSWKKLLDTHPPRSPVIQSIWSRVAAAVGATHVAINASIPPRIEGSSGGEASIDNASAENILRSPINIMPIYGNFGLSPDISTPYGAHPNADAFQQAFWVKHTQNGIHQIWAPLYTMFSRGNIREKTRVLKLDSVLSCARMEIGCTAVDLYAGIGYFAFSYRKAGIGKVLCWELNPWSIEGLARGAQANGWTQRTFTHFPLGGDWEQGAMDSDFLIFQQSNEEAVEILEKLPPVPPIRHVNCGLLPSSRLSWGTAVRAIDKKLGGWIHAHENVGVGDIESKKEEVLAEMQEHLDRVDMGSDQKQRRVKCEHVERVKTYAPGVLHVVLDIWVDGGAGCDE